MKEKNKLIMVDEQLIEAYNRRAKYPICLNNNSLLSDVLQGEDIDSDNEPLELLVNESKVRLLREAVEMCCQMVIDDDFDQRFKENMAVQVYTAWANREGRFSYPHTIFEPFSESDKKDIQKSYRGWLKISDDDVVKIYNEAIGEKDAIGKNINMADLKRKISYMCKQILESDIAGKDELAVRSYALLSKNHYFSRPDGLSRKDWLDILDKHFDIVSGECGEAHMILRNMIADLGERITDEELEWIIFMVNQGSYEIHGFIDEELADELCDLPVTPRTTAFQMGLFSSKYGSSGWLKKLTDEQLQEGLEYLKQQIKGSNGIKE